MSVPLALAFFAAIVGIAVVVANPRRFANQAFGILSCNATAWIALVHLQSSDRNPVQWVRPNAAIASLIPWSLWVLKVAIDAPNLSKFEVLRRSIPWFVASVLLIAICFMDSFIRVDNGTWKHGVSYVVHSTILGTMYGLVILQAARQMVRESGIRRLEIQFFVFNLGICSLLCLLFVVIGNIVHSLAIKRLALIVIFGSYILTAWAIAFQRVFDVWHVVRAIVQRLGVIVILTGGFLFTRPLIENQLPQPGAIFLSAAIWGSIALWFNRESLKWLGLDNQRHLWHLRHDTIEIARTEPETERLVVRFEKLLCENFHTRNAALLLERGATHVDGAIELAAGHPAHASLCDSGWATPESVQRRRDTHGLKDLRNFLAAHSLAVLLTVPRGSSTPSLLVALGTKTNDWPFTYPEVERLQNIAELMDNILTRSRLTAQAAMQARMEHLAVMSRGLAHDLKNLITPVSSFLVHTDGKYVPESAEAEVHAAARRSVRVMTEYVREAMFFADQLKPRFESADFPSMFAALAELTAARATAHGISIKAHADFSTPVIVDGVLLQRMLVNLVNNAIDASPTGKTVTVSAISTHPAWCRLRVIDQGCGIASEDMGRIFEPYFTTKAFGDEMRGFGLGLTICEKIVHLHGGTITVQSVVGHGTTVTVDLPTKPPARPTAAIT